MKKSLSLVLAIAMVFSMFSSMAFAAENQSAGDYLKSIGVIKGTLSGDLQENDTWTRQDVTVILSRLMGAEAEAQATAKSHTFADVTNPYYDGFISWAKAEGLFNGHTDVRFGYDESITNQQFLAVMTRALGYNFDYNNVVEEAIALGLVDAGIDAGAEATRGSYYNVVVQTLHTVTADGQVLGQKLELEGFAPAVASYEVVDANNVVVTLTDGTEVELELETALKANEATVLTFTHADVEYEVEVTWVVDELAVTSVKSDYSNSQFKVTFSSPVDTDTVKITAVAADADTIKVLDGSNKVNIKAVWNDDKTEATITTASTYGQEKSLKLVVNGVANVAGQKLEESETTVVLKDVVKPEVVSVGVTSSKTLEVVFSEPITQTDNVAQVWDNITIDGGKAVGTFKVDSSDSNKWTMTLNSRLAVGAHTVVINSFKDNAGFAINEFTGSVTVIEDTTAPEVVSVEIISKGKVKVNFSEPVTTDGYVNIKSTQYDLNNTGKVAFKDSNKAIEVTLDAGKELDAASTYGETLRYKNITDNEGNKVADEKTFIFNAPVVSTKPTASFALESDNTIVITFDRSMVAADLNNIANYELYDKDNKKVDPIAATFTLKDNNKKVEVDFTTPNLANIDPANYTVKVKNMKDDSVIGNTMADASYTFAANDTNAPTFVDVRVIATNKIRVVFSEAMDVASIGNLNNYIVTIGASTKYAADVTDAKAEVAADGKSVTLTLKDITAGDSIRILGVKDAAGKQIDSADFNAAKAITAADTFVAGDVVATATGARTIEVVATGHTFDSVINANAFKLADSARVTSPNYYVTNVVVSTDGTKATLTLNADLNTNATVTGTTYGLTIYTHTGTLADSGVKDAFGTKLDIPQGLATAINVADGIAPTVASVKSETTGVIEIKLSEVVNGTNTATVENDIIIKDQNGAALSYTGLAVAYTKNGAASTAADFDTVTISGLAAAASGKTYTVDVISRNIKDAAGKAVTAATKTVVIK